MDNEYCLYNAIKTPDGTILWCEHNHDFKEYTDKVSGEYYLNDGVGYNVRRSVNTVPYEDLSIYASDDFEKVRTAKFWGSYGKDGKSTKKILSLQEMEDDHISAILNTQYQIKGSAVEKLFLKEQELRIKNFKSELDDKLIHKENKDNKPKI